MYLRKADVHMGKSRITERTIFTISDVGLGRKSYRHMEERVMNMEKVMDSLKISRVSTNPGNYL